MPSTAMVAKTASNHVAGDDLGAEPAFKLTIETGKVGLDEEKNNLVSVKASDGTSTHTDFVEISGKSSMCSSDELIFSSSILKPPHKSNDMRWESIQAVWARDEALHFRFLDKCSDDGSVYLAELTGMKEAYFAMKLWDDAKRLQAQTEREILQSLDHPFLPTLYAHLETDNFSCLVTEYCPGGDLHTLRLRQPNKHFTEEAVKFYAAEVVLAIEYLHMLGIVYLSLNTKNVLLREDGHIMLSDFDLSLRCSVSPTLVNSSCMDSDVFCEQPVEPLCIQHLCVVPTSCFSSRFFTSKSKKERKNKVIKPELVAKPSNDLSMSFVGTEEYVAPEILKGEGHGGVADWWNLGILMYELLYGKTPFYGPGSRATYYNIVNRPIRFPESPAVSFSTKDLISELLEKQQKHRLGYERGANEIKKHPFFEGVDWALIRCATPPDVPKPIEFEQFSDVPMPVIFQRLSAGSVASTSVKTNVPQVAALNQQKAPIRVITCLHKPYSSACLSVLLVEPVQKQGITLLVNP